MEPQSSKISQICQKQMKQSKKLSRYQSQASHLEDRQHFKNQKSIRKTFLNEESSFQATDKQIEKHFGDTQTPPDEFDDWLSDEDEENSTTQNKEMFSLVQKERSNSRIIPKKAQSNQNQSFQLKMKLDNQIIFANHLNFKFPPTKILQNEINVQIPYFFETQNCSSSTLEERNHHRQPKKLNHSLRISQLQQLKQNNDEKVEQSGKTFKNMKQSICDCEIETNLSKKDMRKKSLQNNEKNLNNANNELTKKFPQIDSHLKFKNLHSQIHYRGSQIYFHEDKSSVILNPQKQLQQQQFPIRQYGSGYLNSSVMDESIVVEQAKQGRKLKYQGKPFEIIFKWSQFMEILVLYILFFFFIGPLTSLISKYQTSSFHLSFNIGLLGKNSIFYLILYILFIGVSIIIFFSDYIAEVNFFPFYQVYCFIHFLTLLMLSIKYGYLPLLKFQRYKTEYLHSRQMGEDQLRNKWKQQNNEIIEKELQDSISRKEVELSSFFLEFLSHPSQNTKISLTTYHQYHSKTLFYFRRNQNYSHLKVFNQERDPHSLISAKSVILYLLNYFNEHCADKRITCKALILTILRLIYNISFKVIPSSSYGIPFIITSCVMIIAESFCIFYFVEIAFILKNDLKRKEFLMIQLSYLISPKKVEAILDYNRKKLLPTIAISCPITIRAWSQMRQVILDYGSIFELRSNSFLSSYLILFYSTVIFMLLNFIKIFKIYTLSLNEFLISCLDLLLFFALTLSCFTTAAAVNEQFASHSQLLMINKCFFQEISLNYQLFLNKQFRLQNQIYSTLIKNFKEQFALLQINNFDIQEYAWYIQTIYSGIIKEIKISYEFNPMKVINITVSKNLVFQLFLSMASTMFAFFYDQYIRPKLNSDFNKI